MSPDNFRKIGRKAPLRVGLVLATTGSGLVRLMRITHLFERSVFVMPVSTPNQARYARRPQLLRRKKTEMQRDAGELVMGTLELPPEFLLPLIPGSDEAELQQSAFSCIEELLKSFADEEALARNSFTRLINLEAERLAMSAVSLRRLLLRYWYFGGLKKGLLQLSRGTPAGRSNTLPARRQVNAPGVVVRKRSGRQSRLAAVRGPNEFVVDDEDVSDMLAALARCAKSGPRTISGIHEDYLKKEFTKRHPKIAKRWLLGRIVQPVTARQFRDYVRKHETLSENLRSKIPVLQRKDSSRTLHSSGPGDVYELDATGGQIFIVDSKDPSRVLRGVTIYILIDRWSRFIVSAYATLEPPSWEALRVLMRISFTSRKRRFANIGFVTDDSRWPVGVVPAQIAVDRGSEMISTAMLEAAVSGLQIVPLVLPPLTPDGKGIVERVIGVLKAKMRNRRLKGSYLKDVMDPKTRGAKRNALRAAVTTLKSFYRAFLDEVDKYNHSIHSALEKRTVLRANGVAPTPVAAYQWGLTNLTGIQRPPLSDTFYERMLLAPDRATLNKGVVTYRTRRYYPANDAAFRDARKSSRRNATVSRRRSFGAGSVSTSHGNLDILVDRSDPVELYSATKEAELPRWEVDEQGFEDLQHLTLEEEDSLSNEHGLVIDEASDRASADRVSRGRAPDKGSKNSKEVSDSQDVVRARSTRESNEIKRALADKARLKTPRSAASDVVEVAAAWLEIEEKERVALVELNKKARRK